MKDTKRGKKIPTDIRGFSWEDEVDKERLLREAQGRINNPHLEGDKVRRMDARDKPRARPSPPASISTEEVLEENPELKRLDDYKWRLVAWGKFGDLHIYNGERYWRDWCSEYSKVVEKVKSMRLWPKGGMRRSNPFRLPHFADVEVVQVHWDELEGQYFFQVDKAPGVTVTWWFKDRFVVSGLGEGWLKAVISRRTRPN